MNKEELQSLLEGVRTALTGNQSKLDKNQNNKIDREDFALLRSKKKPMAENADLHGLLEQLYAVLLDEKAARLQEAPYGGSSGAQYNASLGQTADPTNFYKRNQHDNDEIRASIYREDEKRKREEKERRRTAQMDQMENAQYDSIFENIYNLLAEEVPPGESPIYNPPEEVPNPEWNPDNWQRGVYRYLRDIDGNPLLQSPIYYKPTSPMPPMPGETGYTPPGTGGVDVDPRPDFPPCPGPGDCLWQWTYTVHWVWNTQGFWELVPNTNQPPGSEDYGGYWKLLGDPLDTPGGYKGLDQYGRPGIRPRDGFWERLLRRIQGEPLVRPPIGYRYPYERQNQAEN